MAGGNVISKTIELHRYENEQTTWRLIERIDREVIMLRIQRKGMEENDDLCLQLVVTKHTDEAKVATIEAMKKIMNKMATGKMTKPQATEEKKRYILNRVVVKRLATQRGAGGRALPLREKH